MGEVNEAIGEVVEEPQRGDEFARVVDQMLVKVGLGDTVKIERAYRVNKTEWYCFRASREVKNLSTDLGDDLVDRRVALLKQCLVRARITGKGIQDGGWYVTFEMNAESLSKLLD